MAQRIKVTIAKLGNLSSIPRTHIEAGEKWLLPLTSDLHMSAYGIPSMRLSSSLRDFACLTIEFRWWYRNSFLLVRVLVMPSNLILKWNNSDLKEVSLFFWMETVQRYEAWKWDVERKHQKHRFPWHLLVTPSLKDTGIRHILLHSQMTAGDSVPGSVFPMESTRNFETEEPANASSGAAQSRFLKTVPPPSNYTLLVTLSTGEFANKVFWLGILPHGLNLGFCYYERMG